MKTKLIVDIFSKLEITDFPRLTETRLFEGIAELVALKNKTQYKDPMTNRETMSKIFKYVISSETLSNRNKREILINRLSTEEIIQVCDYIGHQISDDDEGAKYLSNFNWESGDNTKKFIEALNLPKFLLPPEKVSNEYDWMIPRCDIPFKPLKYYQSDISTQVQSDLNSPNSRVLICMPTGSGKTRTCMDIVTSFFNSNSKPKNIVWIVDAPELAIQAYNALDQTWRHIGWSNLNVSIEGYGYKSNLKMFNDGHSFIICSIQSLWRLKSEDEIKRKFNNLNIDLIVFDEVHKLIADKTKKIISKIIFSNRSTRVVGLSATPIREDKDESKELVDFFRNNIKILNPQNQQSTIDWLISEKMLATPIWKEIEYDSSDLDSSKAFRGDELKKEFLERIGNFSERNLSLIRTIEKLISEKKKIIVFTSSVDQSYILQAVLSDSKILCARIDQHTPGSLRKSYLKAFESKELNVMLNYGILATGFDCPKITSVVVARPTTSRVLFSQMVGRGLRGPLLGGTDSCDVYVPNDFLDGLLSPQELENIFLKSWDF